MELDAAEGLTRPELLTLARGYMVTRVFQPGSMLIEQGDFPKGIHYLDQGRVSVQRRTKAGTIIRLRTKGPGSILGEIGFYTGKAASAFVVAEATCQTQFLSMEALRRMEKEAAPQATAFHKSIAVQMSDRLRLANRSIEALYD